MRCFSGLLLLALAGCSASAEPPPGDPTTSSTGPGGSGGSGGTGGAGGETLGLGGTEPTGGSAGSGGACAAEKVVAEIVPADFYVMLDQSGSMQVGDRWGKVTAALQSFFEAPGAEGISVGMQYFGLETALTPGCTIGCKETMSCLCPDWDYECVWENCGCWGAAQNPQTGEVACAVPNGPNSCNPADYEVPDVEIASLPMAAPALVASMAAHSPWQGTPTGVAMTGALKHAKDWALAHPDHKVGVVLASDGAPDPDLCAPGGPPDVPAIAAAALAGTPSIKTWVIAVGSDLDLDAIAAAGGTTKAFNISDANAQQDFFDALVSLTNGALACEYKMPKLDGNQVPKLDEVNLQHTPPGEMPVTIKYVGGLDSCDPALGGWYYDAPANPAKLVVCPATCDTLAAGGEVDILVGCETVAD